MRPPPSLEPPLEYPDDETPLEELPEPLELPVLPVEAVDPDDAPLVRARSGSRASMRV